MLVPKELPKSKVIILASILLIAVGAAAYLVYTNFLAERIVGQPELGEGTVFTLETPLPHSPLFRSDFFSRPEVRDLQNKGALPLIVSPSEVGNSVPFGTPDSASVAPRR